MGVGLRHMGREQGRQTSRCVGSLAALLPVVVHAPCMARRHP